MKWSNKLKRVIKESEAGRAGGGSREGINLAIVSANNHYAGFGPETANMFRKMVGLPSINWQEEDNNNEYKKKYEKLVETNNANTSTVQKSLSDYL